MLTNIVLVGLVGVRPSVDEEPHDFCVSIIGGSDERSEAVIILLIKIGASIEK